LDESVAIVMDSNLDSKDRKLQQCITNYRKNMLGTKNGVMNQGFWNEREIGEPNKPPVMRILVCGNTGVGKSTLINKVFGVDDAVSSIFEVFAFYP
jgi:predicted GTPase